MLQPDVRAIAIEAATACKDVRKFLNYVILKSFFFNFFFDFKQRNSTKIHATKYITQQNVVLKDHRITLCFPEKD